MPLRTRLSLVGILSLGIFAAVAGIIRQLSSSQFVVPEPYIYDAYSVWNFVELDMGIIAASLPALKPLFSWFRGTARGLNEKPSEASVEGYRRQIRPRDEDGFTMIEYGSKDEVNVASHLKDDDDKWAVDRAKSSQGSILPHGDRPRQVGITVTRSLQVEATGNAPTTG
ncbi:hypothetical protein DDE82_007944 [Stemphylium lycopersici]|uniref:Rhodopsin domain-containing protein n=1 Tax=Stemphylium lycopersici TaxID=183478 RepID=A0A364MU83_STELY|nr:hypothetical protein TW65_06894 [Stemphylium lycopersici]RAQ99757.1 hypothetical protein DDE82_007944 [Stemphylium lycopersici]RAR03771.1 hypothetical protein DDE83_008070 [Stemphylium lycopersici]